MTKHSNERVLDTKRGRGTSKHSSPLRLASRRQGGKLGTLPCPKNTNALSGQVTPKRALPCSAPTESLGVAEALSSPRAHHDHPYGPRILIMIRR